MISGCIVVFYICYIIYIMLNREYWENRGTPVINNKMRRG